MRRYRVRLTPEAEEDLLRLYDFLLARDIDARHTVTVLAVRHQREDDYH